tara:strand:- start:1135 stop:2361 length:1227 start_codon:yes stop_codon:yes gene_type:complete
MNQINFLKHLIYFILFFTIIYFETLEFGEIKFAIIWKGVLIIFMLSKFILYKKSLFSKKYFFYGYIFNLKKIVTLSSFTSFLPSLLQLSRSVVFPILLSYLNSFYSNKKILIIIKTLPVYIIISTIPFLLGIIEPLKIGYDLSSYGIDSFGFIGIFQNAHSASMTLAFSLIIILYLIKYTISNNQKIFYYGLIVVGLYALIQTYVRTGLAMLFVGVFVLYLYKVKIIKIVRIIPAAAIILFALFSYYQSNNALQMRFGETNIYKQDVVVGTDNIGSGRLKIASYAINNWVSEGPLSIVFGLGEELAREKMTKTKGSAVFAHNGFVEILQTDGILGMLLYLNFIFLMFKAITKKINKKSQYYKLVLALFFVYLTGMLFQGGDNFYIYVLLACSLSLIDTNSARIEKLNY